MTVFIADIASYQAGLVPAALAPTCVALEIKATQGSRYTNPYYAAWLAETKAAGLLPVAYHYVDGSAPAKQAANLKAHIGDVSVPVMLDVETGDLQQALGIADAMTAAGLRVRLMYLSRSYWRKLGSPDLATPLGSRAISLINASYRSTKAGSPVGLYPGDTASEWAAYGGVTPALLQFTDAAELAGQHVDCNAFRGTAAEFAALLHVTAPPTKPAAPPTASWPEQREGASGSWVTLLQRALMLAGQDPHGVDGNFGANTRAAVKAAQNAFKISADGQCGTVTWGKLQARTLQVQKALAAHGLGAGGTDGNAGPTTASELAAFQREKKLLQDGICGPRTSRALGIPTV